MTVSSPVQKQTGRTTTTAHHHAVAVHALLVLLASRIWSGDAVFEHMDYAAHGEFIILPSHTPALPGVFLVDTGATMLVIDKRFATLLGPAEPLLMATTGGTRRFDLYHAPALDLGAWTIPAGHQAVCATCAAVATLTGLDVAGYIGMAPLRSVVMTVDYDGDRLTLADASPVLDGSTYQSLPMTIVPGSLAPYITLTIRGQPLYAVIDTGNSDCLSLTPDAYDRLLGDGTIRPVGTATMVTAAGTVANPRGMLRGVACGSLAYPELAVTRMSSASPGLISLIGVGFLSRHNLVLDFPQGMLRLQLRARPTVAAPQPTH